MGSSFNHYTGQVAVNDHIVSIVNLSKEVCNMLMIDNEGEKEAFIPLLKAKNDVYINCGGSNPVPDVHIIFHDGPIKLLKPEEWYGYMNEEGLKDVVVRLSRYLGVLRFIVMSKLFLPIVDRTVYKKDLVRRFRGLRHVLGEGESVNRVAHIGLALYRYVGDVSKHLISLMDRAVSKGAKIINVMNTVDHLTGERFKIKSILFTNDTPREQVSYTLVIYKDYRNDPGKAAMSSQYIVSSRARDGKTVDYLLNFNLHELIRMMYDRVGDVNNVFDIYYKAFSFIRSSFNVTSRAVNTLNYIIDLYTVSAGVDAKSPSWLEITREGSLCMFHGVYDLGQRSVDSMRGLVQSFYHVGNVILPRGKIHVRVVIDWGVGEHGASLHVSIGGSMNNQLIIRYLSNGIVYVDGVSDDDEYLKLFFAVINNVNDFLENIVK